MNDSERRMWVENYEPLYQWWRSTRIGLYRFVRTYRAEIDLAVLAYSNTKKERIQ